MKFLTFYVFAVFLIAEFSAIDEIYHVSPETYKRLHQILPQAQNSSPSSSNSSTVYIIVDNVFTVLYSNSLAYCRQHEPRLGDFCSSDGDCDGLSYSICSNSSCQCAPNYRQERNFCLGLINGECSKDQECAVKGSKCLGNSCQCPDGFYKDEICQKYAGLNEECKSKEGCSQIPYSGCLNGKCLCLPNYREFSGSCLGLINASCNNSTNCATANAICDETCQCPENFYFEDNICYKYANGFYESVSSARACERLENSKYASGWCECSTGFYEEANRCHRIPLDYETPVDSAKACDYLSDAYYAEGKCHSSLQDLNEFCYDNQACKANFSKCLNSECHCREGYIERNGSCLSLINTECFWDQDCGIEGSKCLENSCQCPDGFYLDEICIKYASLNGECKSEEECSQIPYSGCLNGKCLCRPNYEESSGSCLGLVNTPCNNSTECTADAICEGTCRCPSNFYEEDHHCYKIPTDYETSVASARACQFLEDAQYISGACFKNKKLNEICSHDRQCGDSFSECSGQCKCKHKYFQHDNRCYAPIGGECKIDKDCPTIWYSCVSGICQQSLYEKRDGYKYSSKTGATARWDPDHYLLNPNRSLLTSGEPYLSQQYSINGDVGHLGWVSNSTLDRAIPYYSDNKTLSILCRHKHPRVWPGIVKFPGDGLCHLIIYDNAGSFLDYEVYVDLGPLRSRKRRRKSKF